MKTIERLKLENEIELQTGKNGVDVVVVAVDVDVVVNVVDAVVVVAVVVIVDVVVVVVAVVAVDVSVGDVSFQRRKSLAIEKFEQVFHLFLTIEEKNGSIEKITLPCIYLKATTLINMIENKVNF